MLALIYFIILAVVALGAAVCVFLSRHPLYGALSLVTSMVALAGIYGLIGSPFLGVVQIMVYAGAIMMLVTFVIMVLNGARDSKTPMFDKVSLFVIPAVIVLAGLVGFAFVRSSFDFDVARIDGVFQRINSGLVELNVLGDLVLLVDAVFTEQQLRRHHRDGDDDCEQG